MKLLQDSPDLSQRALAKKLGISFGGLNYCLNALKDKGWVKMQNFSQSKNKLGYVYLLTPAGALEKAALAGNFLKRKLDEYEALKAEIAALKSDIDITPHVMAPPAVTVSLSVIASEARQPIVRRVVPFRDDDTKTKAAR